MSKDGCIYSVFRLGMTLSVIKAVKLNRFGRFGTASFSVWEQFNLSSDSSLQQRFSSETNQGITNWKGKTSF